MLASFKDIQVLQRLDETHGGSTQIIIGKHNEQLIVCKSIKKQSLKDSKSIDHVKQQKEALVHFTSTDTKGVNRLITTFQDQSLLYLVLQPVKGLPLHKLLQMVTTLNQPFTCIIVSQIGLILQSFHRDGYIYRDIKASNFMVDQKGRVTMIDLGHAKKIDQGRTFTVCGTTHSMPPQIYSEEGYSFQFDYYGFGILVYELLTGKAPFGYHNTNPHILEQMKQGMTEQILNRIKCPNAKDLIGRLLAPASLRLGSKGGFQQIMQHDYFNVMQFCTAKDIYDGQDELDPSDPNFQTYLSQIQDFGIQDYKFQEILPQDPFYKFYQ